jgi:DNA-binding CsgD family transcriptional regulator
VADLDQRLRAVGICSGDGLVVSLHRGEHPEAPQPGEADGDGHEGTSALVSRLTRVVTTHEVTTARQVVVDELLLDLSAFWLAGECLLVAARLALKAPHDDAYVAIVRESAARILESAPLDACYSTHVHALLAEAKDGGSAELWCDAQRRWDAAEVPLHAAECRLRLGQALIRDGDTDGVEALLGAALATAQALGATPLADEITTFSTRARLRMPGQVPADAGPKGPLTNREHEVLQLLVQGMTNDQIGAALFMSPRTASVHVSHILAKLGAANRTEVAPLAHRRGLVSADH